MYRQTPTTNRLHNYDHHPMVPVHQAQQAVMRKILQPDELKVKPDIGETESKYEQETDHVADAGAAGNI